MDNQQIDIIKSSDFFDPVWYLEQYPDVSLLGMDPAEHFLRLGWKMGRDPGPCFSTLLYTSTNNISGTENPLLHFLKNKRKNSAPLNLKSVLAGAANLQKLGRSKQAIALAERYLPEDTRHSAIALRANEAIREQDETAWLNYLNKYLTRFGNAPVELKGTGPLFDRLCCPDVRPIAMSEKVSVIMTVWNSVDTVRMAARSILGQTWQNLELIIVDDQSTDGTWLVLEELAREDQRVKTLRNTANVGPYVSKNIALQHADGAYITCHDADDWAHPQRLEHHMREVGVSQGRLKASITHMIRLSPDGTFSWLGKVGSFSFDGIARLASVSCLFERKFMTERLGYWDCVRFGADSEMIARCTKILGTEEFATLQQVSMLCLDHNSSLTNHPTFGIERGKGVVGPRLEYRTAWQEWHAHCPKEELYLPFPPNDRPYLAPESMTVSTLAISENLTQSAGN